VFGSNLFLDSKKARGEALKPWSDILSADFLSGMVGTRGLEPPPLAGPDPKSGVYAISPRAQIVWMETIPHFPGVVNTSRNSSDTLPSADKN
jgi:hypothetical protein